MPELSAESVEKIMNGTRTDVKTWGQPKAEVPIAAEPAVPPPVQTPEVISPPAQPSTPPAQSDDFYFQFNQRFGRDVKTDDDIKSVFEKASKVSQYEEQVAQLARERDEYKTKTEINPFANEREAKRNDLIRAGASPEQIKAFEAVNETDFSKQSPIDNMKLALQLRDGLTPQEAERLINRNYNLDPDSNSEQDIADSMLRIKVDARRDVEFLQSHKVAVSTPPASPQAENARIEREQTEAYVRQAEPVIKDLLRSFEPFKGFSLNGKQGDDAQTIDLPMSPEFKAQIAPDVLEYARDNKIDVNSITGKELVSSFITNLAKIENFDNAVRHASAEAERKIRVVNENPSVLARGPESGTAKAKTEHQSYLERIASGNYRR